jgi:hypothetical protein
MLGRVDVLKAAADHGELSRRGIEVHGTAARNREIFHGRQRSKKGREAA